jgi:Uncharacterized conserved protein (COG2071)
MRRTRADRAIEVALLLTLPIHVFALVTMAALLLSAMPGPGLPTPELRLAYIAAHPLRWHIGWFPWHLCALSDLGLSAALLTARWIPKRASIITFAVTVVAFVIEQYYEILWDISAPHFTTAAYAPFEQHVFFEVCVVAATLYALMAIGWSWSLSFAPDWTRWLTALSCIAWPVLLFAASAPLLAPVVRVPQSLIDLGNKAGFALMTLWFVFALEAVLRRTRVTEPFGRMSAWRAPRPGVFGWVCELIANSRFLQYVAEFAPRLAMASDIRNVIYINYLVEAERLQPLVPGGLELQTLGNGRYALLSVLIYKHGAFGMNILGKLRRSLMPSPLQSNWRVYVREPSTGATGVSFFANGISSTITALIARVLSRGVSMDVPAEMFLAVDPGADCIVHQRGGEGSAYDLDATLHFSSAANAPLPPGAWTLCFASYADFFAYCIPQNCALSVQSWDRRTTSQDFDLEGVSATSAPLIGEVDSPTLQTFCGNARPVCFLVPRVDFLLKRETTLLPGQLAAAEE